jgi:cytochrome c-type biogenesis protein
LEISLQTLILLPIGLGLLGFIEPYTIGGHLLFLDTQNKRSDFDKIKAVLIFVSVRSMVAGFFGALIAFVGQKLIGVQTGIWLIFGLIYLAIGVALFIGKASLFKMNIDFAPLAWKNTQNSIVLGLAFGLNIPACAAPILFGLLGLAATVGTVFTGFLMMFLFGLFLSFPLIIFAVVPRIADGLNNLGHKLKQMRWLVSAVFVLLGIWSIWFGLYVDPENWAGR